MNVFSRSGLLALGFAAIALPASAQPRAGRAQSPEQRVERRVNQLDEQLGLTDTQEAQLRTILAERAPARPGTDGRPAAPPAREARRAEHRARAEATERAIQNLLTPEQRTRYAALKAERKGRDRSERRASRTSAQARRPAPRPDAFAARLNLTDAQKARLQPVMQARRESARAWAQANPNATREQKRAHAAEQARASEAALDAVLTPAQREQLRALKAERRAERPERRGERRGTRPGRR